MELRKVILLLAFVLTPVYAHASESTLVTMDNATIKTVHVYKDDLMNWEDDSAMMPDIVDPAKDARCFESIQGMDNRAERYSRINWCLQGALA